MGRKQNKLLPYTSLALSPLFLAHYCYVHRQIALNSAQALCSGYKPRAPALRLGIIFGIGSKYTGGIYQGITDLRIGENLPLGMGNFMSSSVKMGLQGYIPVK